MGIEIKYISGSLEKGSTIVVDIHAKGLTSPVSFMQIVFGFSPSTAFELIEVEDTNDLFSEADSYPKQLYMRPMRIARFENKNDNGDYIPVELPECEFVARVKFSVTNGDIARQRDCVISVDEIVTAKDPKFSAIRIASNVRLVFSPSLPLS